MAEKISLVIPARNEELTMVTLLESVMAQSLLPSEIVITDGGSTDRTASLAEGFGAKGIPVRVIRAGPATPGKGRNIAIEHAANEWIAMTDAGIRLDKEWLKELALVASSGEADIVYGALEPVADTFFRECLVIASLSAPKKRDGLWSRSDSIASCLVRRSVWKKVGGFPDLRSAEDRIFMEKANRCGVVRYAPRAKVFWQIPGNAAMVFERFSSYSMHGLIAGRSRDWHRPVLVMYAAAAVLVAAGMLLSPIWFAFLMAAAAVRVITLIIEKMPDRSLREKLTLARIAMVGSIVVLVDLALFWGIVKFCVHKAKRGRL